VYPVVEAYFTISYALILNVSPSKYVLFVTCVPDDGRLVDTIFANVGELESAIL
jgi:hypothetical protein